MNIHSHVGNVFQEISAMDVYGLLILALEIFLIVVMVRLFLMAWDAIVGRMRR